MLSNLLVKIVNIIVLNKFTMCFRLVARSMAHFKHVVKKVIKYYIGNGSNMFACAIDVPKAFNLVKLFSCLLL